MSDERAGDPGSGEYASALSQLHRLMLDYQDTESFLWQLVVLAARTMGEGVSCGIAVQYSGPPVIVASSDALATLVHEMQCNLGEGPCPRCLQTGDTVQVADTAGDARWPGFAARAAAAGARACLCLPLGMQGLAATLSFCATAPHRFGATEVRRAATFADYASSALILGSRRGRPPLPAGRLPGTLAARATVDQALGVIMAEQRCTSSRAWAVLRTTALNRDLTVNELAREIVAGAGARPARHRGRPGHGGQSLAHSPRHGRPPAVPPGSRVTRHSS